MYGFQMRNICENNIRVTCYLKRYDNYESVAVQSLCVQCFEYSEGEVMATFVCAPDCIWLRRVGRSLLAAVRGCCSSVASACLRADARTLTMHPIPVGDIIG